MRCILVPSLLKERGLRHLRSAPNWQKRVSRCSKSCRSQNSRVDFGWGYDGVDLFAPTQLVRHAGRLSRVRGPGTLCSASA